MKVAVQARTQKIEDGSSPASGAVSMRLRLSGRVSPGVAASKLLAVALGLQLSFGLHGV
jgi:hypothetical protein